MTDQQQGCSTTVLYLPAKARTCCSDTHAVELSKICNSCYMHTINKSKQLKLKKKNNKPTKSGQHTTWLLRRFIPIRRFHSIPPKSILSLLQVPWRKHRSALVVDNILPVLLKKLHDSGETQCAFQFPSAPVKIKDIAHPLMWLRMNVHWPSPDPTCVWKCTACSFTCFLLQDKHSIEKNSLYYTVIPCSYEEYTFMSPLKQHF